MIIKTNSKTMLKRIVMLSVMLFTTGAFSFTYAQAPSDFEIERGRMMLKTIRDDLKKNYYDPNFHGMDVDARFKTAEEQMKKASSLGQILGIIAQALIELDDSHTFFVPPPRSYRTEYGWSVQMIGDKPYVMAVKPESDADKKGLRTGDLVVSVNGVQPSRKNLWVFKYLYNALRPQPGMHVEVIKPDGKQQGLDVMAKVKQGKRVLDLTLSTTGNDYFDLIRESENESHFRRHRYIEMGDDLFIWKMPQFDMAREEVDSFVGKFRKRKALIIDLRGNGGGYEETLLRLISNTFDHDVKVGDIKRRKEEKPITAKTRGENTFTGKMIVLIDSESGSAAELFARIVQLEKRGVVIGDVSAGAVMRSKGYDHEIGVDTVVPYGASITDADIVMTDGKSLEHIGVTPDQLKLPTAEDLAANRDPVLAYAASLAGVTITPDKAGAMFPIEWRK
jgi:C-terminal processing protease CtpA/Prc